MNVVTSQTIAERQDTVRVLIVEDDPRDAELVIDHLQEEGLVGASRVVAVEAEFCRALRELDPHVVLSDLSMPGFSGQRALQLLRAHSPYTPFIFVSGTMGESAAIEALHAGATDYIMKHNMARLASATRRAIDEASARIARDRAEEELVRNERFKGLAVLAGSLGHDLRNILQPVLMSAKMISERSDDTAIRRYAELVGECANRGLEMIQAMLSFARGTRDREWETVRIGRLLDATRLLLHTALPEHVKLEVECSDPDLQVAGSITEMQQCLVNLCLNAIQAMPHGGTLSLRAARRDARPGAPGVAAQPHVCLSVSDQGVGMDEDVLGKLFTPFFTSKEGGTGLGLVSCQRIVANHGGEIVVESSPGRGTRFDLLLPVAALADVPDVSSPVDPSLLGRGQQVLVIAEEASVRALIGNSLELYRYTPLFAESGAMALDEVTRNEHIDAVIIDGRMTLLPPDVTVRKLAELGVRGPVVWLGGGAPPGDPRIRAVSAPLSAPGILKALAGALDGREPESGPDAS